MADIATTVSQLMADGTVPTIASNPAAQFGTPQRTYLGASLLPEMTVEENAYREESIRYRTVIANSGTRYSPTQKKGNELIGSFLVELGDSDIAAELTAREYDTLIRLLNTNATMEAAANIVQFLDIRVNRALIELNEAQRWQAITNASVVRTGDNAYAETVAYPNPSGHRVAAAAAWSNDATDPMDDIATIVDMLAGKGYTVNRIITSRAIMTILANNAKMKARAGVAVVNSSGQITGAVGRASLTALQGIFESDGLPAPEMYDLQYRTQTGSAYFLERGAMVFACTTGRDMTIDRADAEPIALPDTLGYVALGRATGQPTPGRVLRMEAKEDKPPRVLAEGWQTALPVLTDPEAVAVIDTIS